MGGVVAGVEDIHPEARRVRPLEVLGAPGALEVAQNLEAVAAVVARVARVALVGQLGQWFRISG